MKVATTTPLSAVPSVATIGADWATTFELLTVAVDVGESVAELPPVFWIETPIGNVPTVV